MKGYLKCELLLGSNGKPKVFGCKEDAQLALLLQGVPMEDIEPLTFVTTKGGT